MTMITEDTQVIGLALVDGFKAGQQAAELGIDHHQGTIDQGVIIAMHMQAVIGGVEFEQHQLWRFALDQRQCLVEQLLVIAHRAHQGVIAGIPVIQTRCGHALGAQVAVLPPGRQIPVTALGAGQPEAEAGHPQSCRARGLEQCLATQVLDRCWTKMPCSGAGV